MVKTILLLLLLLPSLLVPKTFQCFEHDSKHTYILINRFTGEFEAADCESGFTLKGDGLLRFKGKTDRSFTLTYGVTVDGERLHLDCTFDHASRQFVAEVTNLDDPTDTKLLVVAGPNNKACRACEQ